MKHLKPILGILILVVVVVLIAADHIDAPEVRGTDNDITDLYAFQGENTNNLVLAANIKGLLAPSETASAEFSENTLIEFNIDNNGDAIEDLVIQAIPRDGRMYFFGPFQPSSTGLNSTIDPTVTPSMVVDITPYGQNPIVTTNGGISVFAGPRDDPFFMDIARFMEIVGGTASSFNDPGADTFAGTNVLSIVVEVPKTLLNSTGTGTINTWVESKEKN